jgi:hypothetical protein
VGLDAGSERDVEPPAELDGGGGEGEVALGADLQPGRERAIGTEAQPPQRRDPSRRGIKTGIKAARRDHEIALAGPVEPHGAVPLQRERSERVAVNQADVDRNRLVMRVDHTEQVGPQVQDLREARDLRLADADDRHLPGRKLHRDAQVERHEASGLPE